MIGFSYTGHRVDVTFLNVVLPLGSSVLSFAFAAMVLDQWWQRRQGFQLVWGIGLVWYGIAAGSEFWGGAFGWSETVYRTWYLIGAFFVAAYLGAGTVLLLAKTRFGYFVGGTVLFGGIYSAYVYMPKKRVLPARMAVLAVAVNFVASLPGAVAALRQGRLNSRVPATILIALGAFIPGLTSSLNRFGVTWSFFLGEFLGLLLIFVGFLVSVDVFRNVRIGITLWSRHPSASLESEVG